MIWFYGATEEEDETHATGYKKPISGKILDRLIISKYTVFICHS